MRFDRQALRFARRAVQSSPAPHVIRRLDFLWAAVVSISADNG